MAFARPADDARPMSNLNTTPLIDVLLVLIIMLILTIPTQSHKIGIALPAAAKTPEVIIKSVRNRITIDAAGTIAWNDRTITRDGLRSALVASMRQPLEPALDLQPTADARYEVVNAVLADIKRAGVTKLGLPGNEAYGVF
jgi:biopolymer transport protein ExbD